MKFCRAMLLTSLFLSSLAHASTIVTMYGTTNNASIGTIILKDTPNGLAFIPNLHNLVPGKHGFHIHQHPSCQNHGEAAGGHLDPYQTHKHLGPYSNKGHLGDLPVLEVAKDGTATKIVVAPRLKLQDASGHSLMIHEGGDNYSDQPQKLGGGGKRIACGVIPKK